MARPRLLAHCDWKLRIGLFSLLFCSLFVLLIRSSLYQQLGGPVGGLGSGPPHRLAPERYRACDRELASRYHTLAPRDTSEKARQFRSRAWRLLSAGVSAFERLIIPHWLGRGSLLGFVRQCEFEPAMKDVDVEVDSEAFTEGGVTVPQLEEAITSAGLTQISKFGMLNDSLELAFVDAFGTKMDVFLSYPEGKNRYIAGVEGKTLKRLKWAYRRIDLCWSTLEGLVIGVPCDSPQYLQTSYGLNWTKPSNTKWDWRSDGANTENNGYWPEEVKNEVIHNFIN